MKDANGEDIIADTTGDFTLMTITRENRYIREGQGYQQVNDTSHVCAIGSTMFASNALLGSNAYGNTDLLLSILRVVGREIVPVGLDLKPMYTAELEYQSTEAETASQAANPARIVTMVLVPMLGCLIIGTIVLFKRRVRHH